MNQFLEERDDYWIVKDDRTGKNAFVLKTAWSNRYTKVISKYRVKIIRLNQIIGWTDSDLSFLTEIRGLQGVDVLSENVTDARPIFEIKSLRSLSLFCKAKDSGDFSTLKHLRSVALEWRKVFDSLLEMDRLQSINIIGYPEMDLKPLATNARLERLRLESRKLRTLGGIGKFKNLRQLELYRCRNLQSIDRIGAASRIEEIRVSNCGNIQDWTPIGRLGELKTLEIKNCHEIPSVSSFAKCRKLERLQIAGATKVLDGDFDSLMQLRKLRSFLLARKHQYTNFPKDLENVGIGKLKLVFGDESIEVAWPAS